MKTILFLIITFSAFARASSFDPNQNLFYYDSTQTIIVYSGATDCSRATGRCHVDVTDSTGRTESLPIVGDVGDVLSVEYNFPRLMLKSSIPKAYITFWGGTPLAYITKTVDMGFKDVKPPSALKPAARPAKAPARRLALYRLDGRMKP